MDSKNKITIGAKEILLPTLLLKLRGVTPSKRGRMHLWTYPIVIVTKYIVATGVCQ